MRTRIFVRLVLGFRGFFGTNWAIQNFSSNSYNLLMPPGLRLREVVC